MATNAARHNSIMAQHQPAVGEPKMVGFATAGGRSISASAAAKAKMYESLFGGPDEDLPGLGGDGAGDDGLGPAVQAISAAGGGGGFGRPPAPPAPPPAPPPRPAPKTFQSAQDASAGKGLVPRSSLARSSLGGISRFQAPGAASSSSAAPPPPPPPPSAASKSGGFKKPRRSDQMTPLDQVAAAAAAPAKTTPRTSLGGNPANNKRKFVAPRAKPPPPPPDPADPAASGVAGLSVTPAPPPANRRASLDTARRASLDASRRESLESSKVIKRCSCSVFAPIHLRTGCLSCCDTCGGTFAEPDEWVLHKTGCPNAQHEIKFEVAELDPPWELAGF